MTKPRLSNLKADHWLLFAISILLIAVFALVFLIAPPIPKSIELENKSDTLAVFIGCLTLVAAVLTIWVSWLVKEEAVNISENATKIQIKTIAINNKIQTIYPSIRSEFEIGVGYALRKIQSEILEKESKRIAIELTKENSKNTTISTQDIASTMEIHMYSALENKGLSKGDVIIELYSFIAELSGWMTRTRFNKKLTRILEIYKTTESKGESDKLEEENYKKELNISFGFDEIKEIFKYLEEFERNLKNNIKDKDFNKNTLNGYAKLFNHMNNGEKPLTAKVGFVISTIHALQPEN